MKLGTISSMWTWLKRLLDLENEKKNKPAEATQAEPAAERFKMTYDKPKKRFEIEIYDQVSVGEPPYDKIQL